MTNADRAAKIRACKNLAMNGATEGERAAARAAIQRLMVNAPPSFLRPCKPRVARKVKAHRPKRGKKKNPPPPMPSAGESIFNLFIAFLAGLAASGALKRPDEDGWL